MADVVHISERMPVRKKLTPRLCTDELAQIGNPELLLSDALANVKAFAKKVAEIKSGEQGEADCIREVLKAFRGDDWMEKLDLAAADDGA